jgi:hypothetical protein
LARPAKGGVCFVKPPKWSSRTLHIDYDGAVEQGQWQHADSSDSEWSKRPVSLRPAANKPIYAAAASVP